MRFFHHLKLSFTTFGFVSCLFLPLAFSAIMEHLQVEKKYLIEKSSKLYLEGSSNVTDFKCHCRQQFEPHKFSFQPLGDGARIQFSNTVLQLQTTKLDCKHSGINKDMYKTLRADEYPHILIRLEEVNLKEIASINENMHWVDLQSNIILTIAGVSKRVTMKVRGVKLADNRYRFLAAQEVRMSDYKLDPPKPMFGLVKVHDKITIQMDLTILILS